MEPDGRQVDVSEAARQLELAVHDAQVSFDCIALGNMDRAHTHAITARAAADAAEVILRAYLSASAGLPGLDEADGDSFVSDL